MSADISLKTSIASLNLLSPCINASGPMGWFYEYAAVLDYRHLGAFVLKGLTRQKRSGTEGRRMQLLPNGMINSIGLENLGLEGFMRYTFPAILRHYATLPKPQVPIIANINGIEEDDYAYLAEKLEALSAISAIEINLSCPNLHRGGLFFLRFPEIVKRVIRSVRKSSKTLIVKLPYFNDMDVELPTILRILLDEGTEIISAINTIPSNSPVAGLDRAAAYMQGGISGNAIQCRALELIRAIRNYCPTPIIGIGGVHNLENVLDFFKAGANAIGIGTAIFSNPLVFTLIYQDMQKLMQKQQLYTIDELRFYAKMYNRKT